MDFYFYQISAQSLNCVCHIFTWIPANQHQFITSNLLSVIFFFATFVSCEKSNEFNSLKSSKLGALALSCINELLSKKFVSSDAAQLFHQVFQNTFQLLQTLLKEDENECLLNSLDEDYILKMTEFLRLFIADHFARIEYHKSFPIVEFLALLFQFTFRQKHCDRFLSLLDIWTIFIEIMTSFNSSKRLDFLEKYKCTLLSFASQVTCKIQFKYNQNGLKELDDESTNDDNVTELQHFLNSCSESVVKVADLFPLEVIIIVDEIFQENMKNCQGLEYFIAKDENGKPIKLNISNENDIRRLHGSLRDLVTSLKMLAHLSVDMVSEYFEKWFYVAKPLVDNLINFLVFIDRLKMSTLETWDPVLSNDLSEVHSQLLLTLKAFVPWLSQFNCNSINLDSNSCSLLVTVVVNECIDIIICNTHQYNHNIVHCAILCLHHITLYLRSKLISTLESIQLLYTKFCSSIRLDISGDPEVDNLCFNLPLLKEDEIIMCNIFSNIFILPWPLTSDEDQDWSTRFLHHSRFIQTLSEPIISPLKANSELLNQLETQECYKILLKRTLPLFSNIIYNHQESPNRSKQLLLLGMKEIFELSIRLLSTFIPKRDTCEEILELFLSGYDVLRSQVKLNYVEDIVQIMLQEFAVSNQTNSDNLSVNSNNESSDCRIIKVFFKILSLIVEQPYSSIKSLLPSIISLVFNQLSHLIRRYNDPDLNRQFFKFLHNLLNNNFKYFQKSTLVNSYTSLINSKECKGQDGGTVSSVTTGEGTKEECGESKGDQNLENEEQLIIILQAYGQSFLTSDIGLFKQNLESLETLNNRLHLYSKKLFKDRLLDHFLNLFIETCITLSRELFQEDMLATIYSLASVDFNYFYKSFMPKFLINCEGLDDSQKNLVCNTLTRSMVVDLPSFVKNLQVFVNDVRFFRILNNS